MPSRSPATPPTPPGGDAGQSPEESHTIHDHAATLAAGHDLSLLLPGGSAPMRLDAALGLFLPELGIRARRRLWDWCRIEVNGSARKPGFTLRPGDHIGISPVRKVFASASGNQSGPQPPTPALPVRAALSPVSGDGLPQKVPPVAADPPGAEHPIPLTVVAAGPDYIALNKTAGIHSAHIAGGSAPSLERELARRWPEIKKELLPAERPPDAATGQKIHLGAAPEQDSGCGPAGEIFPVPRLLTRLDRATSGLVLAARHAEAQARFRRLEKMGQVRKSYFALLRGRLETGLHLRRKLDTDGGRLSRVLPVDDPDPARHSLVIPLRALDAGELAIVLPDSADGEGGAVTLVRVEIGRGARHQIRAHLAGAGFPIVGEWLYAEEGRNRGGPLYLHHARVEFPGFSAMCLPEWKIPLPANALNGGPHSPV